MQLTIGAPTTPPSNPTCTYRLTIKCMHGDADLYTEHSLDVKDTAELEWYLNVLETYATKLCWNTQCDVTSSEDWAITVLKWDDEPKWSSRETEHMWFFNLVQKIPCDAHCEDRMASPDRWKVVYFDEVGTEMYVTVSYDDGTHYTMQRA